MRKQFASDAVMAEIPATSPEGWVVSGHSGLWWDDAASCIDDAVRCPYGQPGDRLWVREAWARTVVFGTQMVVYREGDNRTDYGGPWKPSIHMFRQDSRILLEIVSVRVERLQDISEADAQAEGVEKTTCSYGQMLPEYQTWRAYGHEETQAAITARASYQSLWEQINGAGSWDMNPWVWVVEFQRIEE